MSRVALDSGWQGGDAHLEVEGDVIAEVNGDDLNGVIFKLVTPLDMSEKGEAHLNLGAGELRFPLGTGVLEFTFAASDAQARELVQAILAEIGEDG